MQMEATDERNGLLNKMLQLVLLISIVFFPKYCVKAAVTKKTHANISS